MRKGNLDSFGAGTKTATLHIASNDEDENPFNIILRCLSLSFSKDRDGDGLSDAAEFQLAGLGFDFEAPHTDLVNLLFSNANSAGLFTQSQLQALNVHTPRLAKDPLTYAKFYNFVMQNSLFCHHELL